MSDKFSVGIAFLPYDELSEAVEDKIAEWLSIPENAHYFANALETHWTFTGAIAIEGMSKGGYKLRLVVNHPIILSGSLTKK